MEEPNNYKHANTVTNKPLLWQPLTTSLLSCVLVMTFGKAPHTFSFKNRKVILLFSSESVVCV